jgi:predicted acylesterase/phospholipase RssA
MLRDVLWKHLSHVDLSHSNIPTQIDLVMSGGGFLGYYLLGMDRVFKKLKKTHSLRIVRYAGTSVGSFAAVAMVCNLRDEMLTLYDTLQGNIHYFKELRTSFLSILPPNAYELCSSRVFISISVIDFIHGFPILRNIIVSTFSDNNDLVDACMASSNVPFLVSSSMFYMFRGQLCLDGCFTNYIPLFRDSERRQLIVRLDRIPYSWRAIFTPFSNLALPLVIKGALETEMFFTHSDRQMEKNRILLWYTPTSKSKYDFLYKKLFLSLSVLGICFFCYRKKI